MGVPVPDQVRVMGQEAYRPVRAEVASAVGAAGIEDQIAAAEMLAVKGRKRVGVISSKAKEKKEKG